MKEQSTKNVWLPLALSIMLALGMIIGYVMNEKDESPLVSYTPLSKAGPVGQVEELIRFVESRYVDTINRDGLTEAAVNAILQELDPHSIYISPESLVGVKDEMSGQFHGIGIETFYINDTVNIVNTVAGSPSEKAGVKKYDRLLKVDGTEVAGQGLEFSTIQKMIKKKKGSTVVLELLSPKGGIREVSAVVGDIPLKSINDTYNITGKVGYVKIDRFSSTTYREFMDAFETMYESGTQHLIIDLRDNPGGYLPQATNILSQLFKEQGNLLVYTEGRNDTKQEYKTTGKPFFGVDKISVLVNEHSASGSEIIAGAIQDWDRGLVIGRRTFGKGLVQEQYDLSNGGAIRLTVARYYTPSGRSIQRTYADLNSYDNDLFNRVHSGELFSQDSVETDTSRSFTTLKLNREVQGGGGITPDVFIPIDSTELEYQYLELKDKLARYAFRLAREGKAANRDLFGQFIKNHKELSDRLSRAKKAKLYNDYLLFEKKYEQGDLEMLKAMHQSDPYILKSLDYFNGDINL